MKRSLYLFCLAIISMLFISCSGEKTPYAYIETDKGLMKAKLYTSVPQHTNNFIKLAKEGFYDDLLFHRVINGFMIQGGDPQSKDAGPGVQLGNGGPGYTIPAEIRNYHFKGALSAARTSDNVNPQRESSGSQFYVVQGSPVTDDFLNRIESSQGIKYTAQERALYKDIGGTPHLDNQYTVFGEVVEGMEIIDQIAAVPTAQGDRPIEDVKMKIRIIYE